MELEALYTLKGREANKVVSVLVHDTKDIARFAVVSPHAERVAEQFLPGPLTLVLPINENVPSFLASSDGTLGFRISTDPLAQQLIAEFMGQHEAPLTCTNANRSGIGPATTTAEILKQFGESAHSITRVIDGGERRGVVSTVVCVVGNTIDIIRAGAISEKELYAIV